MPTGPHDWSTIISTKPHSPSGRRCRPALRRHLSRTALSGLVRGAATAIGTLAAGAILAWLREHL
ncbi:hypothetical protein AB0G86_41100 [Streptomyces scabiei]|uniref:hypothetical protein n=1 Tax=Streptomyces scabiei TaxID=1930 RepID=UPI00340203B7